MSLVDDQICIPAYVRDLSTFRAWAHSDAFPQTGRIAYIAGQIEVDMNAERIQSHNKVKGDLYLDLGNYIRVHDLGELLPDRALLVNVQADVSNEPDMMFCSWESLQGGKVQYLPMEEETDEVEVVGTPDLVVEIISDSSVKKDKVLLRKLYFAAGISEYWLIDARDLKKEVDFQILTRSRRAYTSVAADRDGYRRSKIFQRSFLLERKTNRIGGASYRLQNR